MLYVMKQTKPLTHLGRVTHICVGKLSIIGSDNGLSPERRQSIIWTNTGIFLIGPLGTNFSEILIEILTFSFKKMRLKVSSAKWRPFCLGLNVLPHWRIYASVHHHWFRWWLMACSSSKHYLRQILGSCYSYSRKNMSVKFEWKVNNSHSRKKDIWNVGPKFRPFCSGRNVLKHINSMNHDNMGVSTLSSFRNCMHTKHTCFATKIRCKID